MNPIPHPAKTRTLGAPPGHESTVTPLEIADVDFYGQRAVMSLWQPTPEEIEGLKAGLPVALFVMGTGMPPVAVAVLNNG